MKNTYYLLVDDLPLNKRKNDLIIGFTMSKQLEITLFH